MNFCSTDTIGPNDPDIDDDFKPTNKLDNSQRTLKDIVKLDAKDNYVIIYRNPEQHYCVFSSLAVGVLSEYRDPLHCTNILEDLELKSVVKYFSLWIPKHTIIYHLQVYQCNYEDKGVESVDLISCF
ncbi:unnamed protein product [Lactuca virosa]|uniref:Uncharacterized protein n=1 Tax=Lactuca virosa TaxID=75947 RepID=A0AAU9MN48_9ASTR|nr:unnamed protein product [Lactuca virosa]